MLTQGKKQGNHQNFDPSLPSKKLGLIFMKQEKFLFFLKKLFQNGRLKKLRFSKAPILEIFLPKFHELVLGLVVLIYAKGIDLAQPISS